MTAAAFWDRVDRSGGPEAHWPWLGPLDEDDNGTLTYHRKHTTASRVAWILTHGDPGPAVRIRRRCELHSCCNPAHHKRQGRLYLVDRPNAKTGRPRKAASAGEPSQKNYVRGEKAPRVTLTAPQVLDIRARYEAGEIQQALADEYRVSRATIQAVVTRRTWRHI